jgi:transposase
MFIENVQLLDRDLLSHSARVLQLWNELLTKAQEIEDELEKAIAKEAAKDDMCRLLETMPGVGPFTALMVRAEIGDIRRFSKPEQLISYAGYAPKVFQSGEKCH